MGWRMLSGHPLARLVAFDAITSTRPTGAACPARSMATAVELVPEAHIVLIVNVVRESARARLVT